MLTPKVMTKTYFYTYWVDGGKVEGSGMRQVSIFTRPLAVMCRIIEELREGNGGKKIVFKRFERIR